MKPQEELVHDLEGSDEEAPLCSDEDDEDNASSLATPSPDDYWWLAGAIARRCDQAGLTFPADEFSWEFHMAFDAEVEAAQSEGAVPEAPSQTSPDGQPSTSDLGALGGEAAAGSEGASAFDSASGFGTGFGTDGGGDFGTGGGPSSG